MAKAKRSSAKKTTKSKTKARKKSDDSDKSPRGLWKGSIAFGLVNIPVQLASAEEKEHIHFRMLDKRDHAPIGYKQYNKLTGKEITRDQIVKGFEFKKGEYAIMTDADFKKANPKATRTIEIEDFVLLDEVDFQLFEKSYYIVPQKGGEKGYALLRSVLEKSEKVAIAKIVLHTVQRLAAVIAREDYLILELLRFADEIKTIDEVDLLSEEARSTRISDREVQIATQLVDDMTSKWQPEKYKNTYREDLMRLVKAKVRKGATAEQVEIEEPAGDEPATNVVDLTALLQKSLRKRKAS